MKEKIAAAAIRLGTEIYTGRTHFEAMRKMLELPDLSADEKVRASLDGEDGFLTDTGRFVTREEAYEIALAASQMRSHELVEPEKNMDFYGGTKPRLDSGLVECYAPLLEKRSYIF